MKNPADRTGVLWILLTFEKMSSVNSKPLPNLPAFQVKDSSGLPKSQDTDINAFVYCSDYTRENYEQYRNQYKLKTDYKYGNAKGEYEIVLERKEAKDAIHIITSEIKRKGKSRSDFCGLRSVLT